MAMNGLFLWIGWNVFGQIVLIGEHKVDGKQADKFKDAAKEHGADEDEKHWEERLRKVAKAKPHPHPDPSAPD